MANAFDSKRIVQQNFLTGLAENTPAFVRAGGRIATGTPGEFRVGGRAIGGLATTLSKTATSSTATDLNTAELAHSTVKKVIHHTVTTEALGSEYALEGAGLELANKVAVSLDKDYFDFKEGLFSAAHPLAGAGAFQKGAGKMYIDTGLAYLQTEGGAGTQNNLLTAALSEAALDSAIQLLNKYKDDRGVPLHLGMRGNLRLVVGPKNRKTARELVFSEMSGADMQINSVGELISDVVVWNWTTDEDDWFVVDASNSPLGMYIAEAPTVRVAPQTNGLFVDLIAEYQAVAFKLPYEYGIIGSNVA
jgi:hypothetical protein